MHEARYYEVDEQGVRCRLCPHLCHIVEGQEGHCRVRRNVGGKLYAMNYAQCSGYALDPIEKKPLYHFFPGKKILSLGTWGCNFTCQFCQNWHISQVKPTHMDLVPRQAVAMALQQGKDNIGIAYTYSEPIVWYEFVSETAELARAAGQKNVLITNGYVNEQPLAHLLPMVDAMNIDVKAFNDTFYQKTCSGRLGDVVRTVEQAASACHVEITTLVIPGLNDSPNELDCLAKWLAGINPDIPLHFSRYYPGYKLSLASTPRETLMMAYETARQHLNYVYLGNMPGEGMNTYCPDCGMLLIDRLARRSQLQQANSCPQCGKVVALVGEVPY